MYSSFWSYLEHLSIKNTKCPICMLQIYAQVSYFGSFGRSFAFVYTYIYILTYTDTVTDRKCMFNFCLQPMLRYIFIELMYTEISTDIHIRVIIIIPLFQCFVKVISSKKVLTGKTPLKQILKILSLLSNSDTLNGGKIEATRILSAFLKILALNLS